MEHKMLKLQCTVTDNQQELKQELEANLNSGTQYQSTIM